MVLTLTPAPDAPSLSDPANFQDEAAAYVAWMATVAGEISGQVLQPSDILGTVSQSGGVPTGEIFERGSNANGEYVRFADGTQICTRTVDLTGASVNTANGSIYVSNVTSYTFPAAFSGAQADFVGASLLGSDNTLIRSIADVKIRRGSSATGISWDNVSLTSPDSITGAGGENTRITLFAVGRWF